MPYDESMIWLIGQRVRLQPLAGRIELGNRQSDHAKAVMAVKYVGRITTRSGDHYGHRLVWGIVIEGGAVRSVLSWLLREVMRGNATPHDRAGSEVTLPGPHRFRRVSRPRSELLEGVRPPHQ